MFGKYRTNVEKIRGDLKGSQVFGFKTPSRSTASTAPISTLAASCSKAGVALGRRRKPGITVNEKENADAYFDAHGDGGEIHTSDRTLGQLKNPRLSQETLEKLLAKEPLR